ncbi:hypothetical protein [Prescottella subtropica]|uniref:hypothetical protein n=1 Tax=Prescottella subtropica TaxID=2545757 RepID=UPI0013869143|nr:hypothetical protein [Prescottella subtropica]
MSDTFASTAADCHRAAALVRARLIGDTATFDHHVTVAAGLERLPQLAGPLVEIGVNFMSAMIGKGAVDAGSVLEWLDRIESALISEELAGGVDCD